MKIGKYLLVNEKELPFHRDVTRLINKHPEYLDGIRAGVVHLAFDPGQRKAKLTAIVNFPQAGGDSCTEQ